MTSLINATLKKGGAVKIQGLRRFKIVKRKALMGRNPSAAV